MKYPLAMVRLIDSDEKVLEGYHKLSDYIKDELNCVELVTDSNEDAYIQYTVVADNKVMGQVFKKKFDKNFKNALAALTNDQIKGYLATGSIDVLGNEVVTGMLKVQKTFTDAILADKNWGAESRG
jgi:isoleucyl-tRNA synthetase